MIPLKIRKVDFQVQVNSQGEFYTEYEGERVGALTLEELRSKLTKLTKKPVNIPFARIYDGRIRHGVIRGVHATNRNLLIKFDGQKGVEQEYGWQREGSNYLALTSAEEEVYLGLHKELKKAQDAVDAFENKHALDVPKALESAGANDEEKD